MQRQRGSLWLWMLVGSIWLFIAGWNFAHYWSGEPLVSDYWYLSHNEPADWGDRHPECRDRFGFWPDGTRMEPKEFEKAGGVFFADVTTGILSRQKTRTPEQIARDDWAHDVRQKLASCEEAQWMPIVKANVIKQERIRVIAFALLPPFLFLSGLGLIRRTTRTISIVGAKLIATVGALSAAIVIMIFVGDISDEFYDIVIRPKPNLNIRPEPDFLRGLDVICAVLIPISIVLWSRRPSPPSKLMAACFLGIAAAFAPVTAQVISRPFIHNSLDGVWAVAGFAVFSAAVLAICVTKHFVKNDMKAQLAVPTVPHYIRKGLIRLYVILLIPWAAWFAYTAYKANAAINFEFSQLREFGQLSAWLDEPPTSAKFATARRELGLMANVWDAKTNDEIQEHIEKALDDNGTRLTTAIYALLAAVAPPFLYPVVLWVLAGFRKPKPITSERRI